MDGRLLVPEPRRELQKEGAELAGVEERPHQLAVGEKILVRPGRHVEESIVGHGLRDFGGEHKILGREARPALDHPGRRSPVECRVDFGRVEDPRVRSEFRLARVAVDRTNPFLVVPPAAAKPEADHRRIPNACTIDYRSAGVRWEKFRRPPWIQFKAEPLFRAGMPESLVGAGGWGYFAGGLDVYAQAFHFVEVNATFYRRIPDAMARRWRARVPADFVFSVKVHREVTHRDNLRASKGARESFAAIARTARILGGPFLILETPASLAFEQAQLDGLRDLSAMVEGPVRIGLEARAYRRGSLPADVRRAMLREGILDVVDVSQMNPRVADESVYTRLFGPGPHNVYEFDDDELRSIDRAGQDAVRAAFTFHGVRMYKDAARFMTFKRTGTFPSATDQQGLASLTAVLRPDARFPTTKDDLGREHGWKAFDLNEQPPAPAAGALSAPPDRTFRRLDGGVRGVGNAPPPASTRGLQPGLNSDPP